MPDRSLLQRLRTCSFFPMTLSMPPSLARDPSCLASLLSNSKLLVPLSQHRSSQVTMCSPGWRLKPFCMSRSLLRDRDQVMISVSISRYDPGSLSSLPERSALFVSFFIFTGANATGTGWSLGSAMMPAAGAGARAAAVPTGATGATPAIVAAAEVVPVWGAVTACWARGAAGPAGGQRQLQCLLLRFPPFPL